MNSKWSHVLAMFGGVGITIVVLAAIGVALPDEAVVHCPNPVYTSDDHKPFRRWAIVETCVKRRTDLFTRSLVRRYIVNPNDEWFIVPEAHKEWIGAITEGQEMYLPNSIAYWRKVAISPSVSEFDPRAGGCNRHDCEDESEYFVEDRGIYFFGSPQ